MRDSGVDPGGLKAIFLAERPALLRYVAARGAGDEAEDVLQDLWLRVARAAAGPIANPRAYLFRAAENVLRDRQRADRQARRRDEDWLHALRPEGLERSDAPSAERTLLDREALARLDARLATLPARARTALALHRLDDLSQKRIAERLGVSLSTVEKDLQRAYRILLDSRDAKDDAE
ncbi:RNA polymerase sigma factor [Sphingomonas morindae]|uniref:Sigma-70 family RNA polymerase sigma factor n=1 Tax=Sphingomonas morindae TaxID=1541170 RepID=A0ABY4XDB6_9SPHN|nr:sigma-70 family RNA polymerase sigma factor [Sphingomonas morindae]USI74839.1 sigma-70 family RNA polymerase sigma factor [Sphingomonas morindae]